MRTIATEWSLQFLRRFAKQNFKKGRANGLEKGKLGSHSCNSPEGDEV